LADVALQAFRFPIAGYGANGVQTCASAGGFGWMVRM